MLSQAKGNLSELETQKRYAKGKAVGENISITNNIFAPTSLSIVKGLKCVYLEWIMRRFRGDDTRNKIVFSEHIHRTSTWIRCL